MGRPKYNTRPRIQVIRLYHCKEEAGSTSQTVQYMEKLVTHAYENNFFFDINVLWRQIWTP
jgi:hypothetical protein